MGLLKSYKDGALSSIKPIPLKQAAVKSHKNSLSRTMATYFQSSFTCICPCIIVLCVKKREMNHIQLLEVVSQSSQMHRFFTCSSHIMQCNSIENIETSLTQIFDLELYHPYDYEQKLELFMIKIQSHKRRIGNKCNFNWFRDGFLHIWTAAEQVH